MPPMLAERSLDQLFLKPSGAGIEVLMVFESLAGARTREHLPLPGRDLAAAVDRLARHLARDASIEEVSRVRLRLDRGGVLSDDAALQRRLVRAFAAARRT